MPKYEGIYPKMPNKLDTIVATLIKKEIFNTQTDLVNALKKQGIKTKQSTVSRALHRIGAIKRVRANGVVGYQVTAPDFKGPGGYNNGLVHEIIHNEMMIVLNTRSGSAGHVAQYVDEQAFPEIIGTLAGDNCIFIMPSRVDAIKTLVKRLKSLFPNAR